jgi:predicted TIM-barrel fold metal-dependent hydrolase
MKRTVVVLSVAVVTVISGCRIKPTADHHQHLMSPAAAKAGYPLPLAAVELPADLARLLAQRAERWRDAAALKQLYTPDAWVLDYPMPGWYSGPDASSRLTGAFLGANKLTPVLFRTKGSTSEIGGYYTRGEGADARYVGYFHITVETTAGGVPLIASEAPSFPIAPPQKPIFADDLIARLDDAGIRRAVVLSNAYFFDGLVPVSGDTYAAVRAENDWTAGQVMRHPDRLVALCSFNPMKDYAVTELERCSKNPAFTGVKLHLGTSGVDLDNPEHVAKTRRVFEAANRLRLPLLVHTAATPAWGREQAQTFVNQLVAAAPDVQVVVAHLWGGAWYNEPALAALADAASSGQVKNLFFEVSSVYGDEDGLKNVAQRLRQIGLERIYFGSDALPKKSWSDFRRKVPLTKKELESVATNVAPWAQRRPETSAGLARASNLTK